MKIAIAGIAIESCTFSSHPTTLDDFRLWRGDDLLACYSFLAAYAEVTFVPGEKSEHKDTQPLRYVAMRIRNRQEELFEDGGQVKRFAIVTNIRE